MAESGEMSLADQLYRYGFMVAISVEPLVFGKHADTTPTMYQLRRWLQENLKDLWDLRIIRRHLWTKDIAYFEVACMSQLEAQKVRDFFNHPA